MNRFVLPFSLLLVTPLILPVQAQERHRNVGIAALVAHRAVHKELNVSDEQKAELKDAVAKARKGFQSIKDLKDDARRTKNREITQKLRQAVAKTLKAEQKKRLLQIEIQYSGAWILRRSDVSKQLELTREQRREIVQLAKKSRETTQKLRASQNDENRREVQRKIADDVAKTREAALKLLTDEQKKKWKQAIGKTLKLPRRGRKKKKDQE